MKKRVRKKLRRGEFRSVGFEVRFELDQSMTEHQRDQLIDEFIAMIEAASLQFGGGGKFDWSGVVARYSGYGVVTEEERQTILDWLILQPLVLNISGVPLTNC